MTDRTVSTAMLRAVGGNQNAPMFVYELLWDLMSATCPVNCIYQHNRSIIEGKSRSSFTVNPVNLQCHESQKEKNASGISLIIDFTKI